MESGHRTFVAGMVLGVVIGLAGGHIALWSRYAALPIPVGEAPSKFAAGTFPQVFQTAELPWEPQELSTAFSTSAVPDAATIAASETPKLLKLPAPDDALLAGQTPVIPEVPAVTSEPVLTEPAPLRVPNASPLADAQPAEPSATATAIRELVETELANRPQHERDVWFDSLKDLSLPHAVGVLEMWKLSGRPAPLGVNPGRLPRDLPGPDSLLTETEPLPLLAISLHDAARQVHLRNLHHLDTPGYKRLIPVRIERIDGSVTNTTRIDFRQGLIDMTGAALDWCLREPGFFSVTDGEQMFYTRYGHFSLNTDREIVLNIEGNELKLHPVVQLPPTTVELHLSASGEIQATLSDGNLHVCGTVQVARFLNSTGLASTGSVLFQESTTSGAAHLASPKEGQLNFGGLELSNVDPEHEWLRIDQLERLDSLHSHPFE